MTNHGDLDEGISLLKKGLIQLNAVGTTEDVPVYTEYLCKALGLAGQQREALTYIDELLETLEAQKLRYWHPELYRRKGLLLLDLGEQDKALELMLKALAMAHQQKALSLALRALLSLHEFEGQTGLYPLAPEQLRDVYQQFSGEQMAPELDKARAILNA